MDYYNDARVQLNPAIDHWAISNDPATLIELNEEKEVHGVKHIGLKTHSNPVLVAR
jgi:hypothetical protein